MAVDQEPRKRMTNVICNNPKRSMIKKIFHSPVAIAPMAAPIYWKTMSIPKVVNSPNSACFSVLYNCVKSDITVLSRIHSPAAVVDTIDIDHEVAGEVATMFYNLPPTSNGPQNVVIKTKIRAGAAK